MKKMRNGIIVLTMLLVTVSLTFAMGGGEGSSGGKGKKIIAAMATDVGGLGDGSFNDGSYAGIKKAQTEGIATARIIESKQMTDYVPNLTGLAEDGADLVFAVGFLMQDAVVEAAKQNPKVKFAGIDMWFNPSTCPKNLVGITWKEQEAGYLAGVVAGLMTLKYADKSPRLNKKNVVGCILGMDIPPCERYEVGFRAGVRSVNPSCVVLTAVAGRFDDQAKGKELTLAMAAQGADIVFQIAGQTGLGVIAGAKEAGILAIGVDVDQYSFAPDTVLTSALKGLTVATFEITRMTAAGQFTGGQNYSFGIKEGAVDIAPFHNFDSVVPKEVKEAVSQAKASISSGSIIVPDTRAKLK